MAQAVQTEQTQTSNFEIFLRVVETFRYSQGFYSRLARDIAEWDDCERAEAEEYFNSQPQWKDDLDCIYFLEC